MRAVVLDADGRPSLVELPEPTGSGSLVTVRGCGLCGSDLEKLGRGGVIGHELDGLLDDGTRVTVLHRTPCGVCARCRAGHESTCEEFAVVRLAPGGFAERIRATEVVHLPDALPELAGVWVEPLACVVRALEAVPRGRVLVAGCGAMGLLWVQALRARGDEVWASDPRPTRLAAAEALRATVGGHEVDAAVLTAHAAVTETLARLTPGGTLLVFSAAEAPTPFPLDLVYRKELHVVGSRSAARAAADRALELLPTFVLPEVTTFPLERFDEGVELYRSGEALKIVFTP